MDQDAVQLMIAQDRKEWVLLADLLDSHVDQPLHKSGPPWNSRDVYAHLARWLEHSNADMEAYPSLSIVSFTPAQVEDLNARWQREDSSLGQSEARLKAALALERRLAIIAAIPLDRWDEQLTRIAHFDGADHFAIHRSYISG